MDKSNDDADTNIDTNIETTTTTAGPTYSSVNNSAWTGTNTYTTAASSGQTFTTTTSGTGYSAIVGSTAIYTPYVSQTTSIGTTTSIGNASYTTAYGSSPQITFDNSGIIHSKNLILDGSNVGDLLTTICDRLAIIENADPKILEKYQALTIAYEKYKFLEKMLVDNKDKPE